MSPGEKRPRLREELLGYLLGALDPSEREQIEAHLEADPELQQELARLRAMTAGLDDCPVEPPGDLSHRTLRYVMERRGPCAGQFASECRWRLQDLIVGVCMLVTVALLIFPAIGTSRSESQVRACQKNLATLGSALITYSRAHGGEFPQVPTEGNLAAAGVYAPTLVTVGLIQGDEVFCPAAAATSETRSVPTIEQLKAAHGDELRRLQTTMGGSYGYSLGFVVDGEYHAIQNRSRPTFAILADLPDESSARGYSHHGECGQNVLFEDGHVQLLKSCRLIEGGDHIYQNELGLVAPGIGSNDAVIAPSGTVPVMLWIGD